MSSSGNIYVAVIDDDESVCRSMSRFLRATHLNPITYPSAEAFLADAKHPKPPQGGGIHSNQMEFL